MKTIYLIIFLMSLSVDCWAAAYTASVTGNWASSVTWGGSGVPGNGDTVTINDSVVVTIPPSTSVIIGTSPANDSSTPAMQCASSGGTGRLIVNGNLTYRGTVQYCSSEWDFGSGSVVTHDSSLATTPSAANYSWSAYTNGTASVLKFNGASGSGNHVTWGIAAGSGNAGHIGNRNVTGQDGLMLGGHVDFSNIGPTSSSYPAFDVSMNIGGTFNLAYATFNNCGAFTVGDISSTANIIFDHINIQNPILSGSYDARLFYFGSGSVSSLTTGIRQVTNSYFDGGKFALPASGVNGTDLGLILQNNWFGESVNLAAIQAYGNAYVSFSGTNWNNNVIYSYTPSGGTAYEASFDPGGYLSNTYVLYGSYSPTHSFNYHATYMQGVATTLDGWIFEIDSAGTTSQNQPIQGLTSPSTVASANFSHTIKNSLFLPDSTGEATEAFYNFNGELCDNSTVFCPIVTFQHNTACANSAASPGFCGIGGEGQFGISGVFSAIEDNLFFSPASQIGCISDTTYTKANLITTADYNWEYNLTGTLYQNYPANYSALPGVHDQTGDPQFFDSSRNFLKWCKSINSSDGSWTDCKAHFALMGTDSFDSRYSIADLLSYVKAGYAPQNVGLSNASSTGNYIGAMPLYTFGIPGYFTVSSQRK